MTIAETKCGHCGAALSGDDKFCAQCGARVEGTTGDLRKPPLDERCRVCGHDVDPGASYCESCGSATREGSRVQQREQRARKKSSKMQPSSGGKRGRRFSLEPWQMITGGIVLVLAALFVYTELTREQSVQKFPVTGNLPAPSAPMMQEIEQLRRSVNANPTDVASLLRLANMLHDAGMQNASLLTDAINSYSKYLVLKPTDPNARVDLGTCYYEMARMDTSHAPALLSRAIEEMQKAFSVDPKHQAAAFNLGIVNLGAGNLEESNKWFNKAKEIDANSELGKKALQMLEQHSFQGSSN
jgi:cytochrome c-type biogenesis protein CcmH/NrfG